jgi:hypothetical protein
LKGPNFRLSRVLNESRVSGKKIPSRTYVSLSRVRVPLTDKKFILYSACQIRYPIPVLELPFLAIQAETSFTCEEEAWVILKWVL